MAFALMSSGPVPEAGKPGKEKGDTQPGSLKGYLMVEAAGGGGQSGRYKGDPRTAEEIIAQEKQGRIRSRFPGEWLDKRFDDIDRAARAGDKSAQTARKLLTDTRFDK